MERFAITLEPINDAVPAAIRLRAVLKAALRQHGLKCVDVKEVKAPADKPVAAGAPTLTTGAGDLKGTK